MNNKQTKIIDWLNELEKYVKEKQLSMRILDKIEECKKKVCEEYTDWEVVYSEVEELLVSIEQKNLPVTVKAEEKKNEISMQAVEEQLKMMAKRCHTENVESQDNIAERKNIILRNLFEKVREIMYTKVHLDKLKNEELYMEFYNKLKINYEKNVFVMIKELLEDISNNYNYLSEHMRSMLVNIGGYKNGIGNEKFYHECEEGKAGLDRRIQSEVDSLEVGGKDILAFGQKTKGAVRKIVKRTEGVRKFMILLPLIILLCTFAVNVVIKQEESQAIIEDAVIESEKTEQQSALREVVIKEGKNLLQKATGSQITSVINAIGTFVMAIIIDMGILLILLLLLIIVIYIGYLRLLRVWCNQRICQKCGEYLQTELNGFEQSNTFMAQIDGAIGNIVEEYERQYFTILNSLLVGTKNDQESTERKEASSFASIRRDWNALKYE